MRQTKMPLPFIPRTRTRRKATRTDDPTLVFKNFVRVLEQLHAAPRNAQRTVLATQKERR
jgi:hypothetical protein